VLGRDFPAIHVKLVADRAFRVKLAMEAEQLDEKAALRRLVDTDANRARYHKEHYGRDWDDPVNFHLVLNTGLLGLEGAAEVIVARARRQGW
jgi:cytidylate kinase